MESPNPLLRRYRDDRRKLLEFLLSSGLVKQIATPAGLASSSSDIEFDHLSADYVLECINSGSVLDVSQATRRYYNESSYPITKHLQSRDVFYLLSDADSGGSPPHRIPPPITMNQREKKRDSVESQPNYPAAETSHLSSQETGINCKENTVQYINSLHNTSTRPVGLPTLKTGLRDDDLRESAYEVFSACMLFSGLEIHSTEGRKREKSSKFLSGLKGRKDKRPIGSAPIESHLKVLDTIRVQMQDSCPKILI